MNLCLLLNTFIRGEGGLQQHKHPQGHAREGPLPRALEFCSLSNPHHASHHSICPYRRKSYSTLDFVVSQRRIPAGFLVEKTENTVSRKKVRNYFVFWTYNLQRETGAQSYAFLGLIATGAAPRGKFRLGASGCALFLAGNETA